MTDLEADPGWHAFVRAIAARPGDDLPRQVAADWMQDQGDPDRADLIRTQCELARKPGHNHGYGRNDPRRKPLEADNPRPLWQQDPSPDDLMVFSQFATVDLALRPYRTYANRRGRPVLVATHYFYAGRCAGCSTTFLMEARESPTPTGGPR